MSVSIGHCFPGSLQGIEARVASALRHLKVDTDGGPLRLMGPIPVFVLPPAATSMNGLEDPGLWRGLLLSRDGSPVGVVDLPHTAGQHQHRASVRGHEPASALLQALGLVTPSHESPIPYDLRIVTVPRSFVTSLWLRGASSLFIPTRLGAQGRLAPSVIDEPSFLDLVKSIHGRTTASHAHGTAKGFGERRNDPPAARA